MKKKLTTTQRTCLLSIVILTGSLIIFYTPLKELLVLSFNNELYSHFIFIPIVSLYFIYSEREKIFASLTWSPWGTVLIGLSSLLLLAGINLKGTISQNDYLSITTLSALLFWIGSFVLVYGDKAFRKACFPLFFLIFMVPVPEIILNKIIFLLQSASTEISYIYFKLIGIPIYRKGFIFELPGINIEVAKQCGGIRSSMVLVIIGTLLARMFLKEWWQKAILIISVFPITVIKNGLRIVTLSLLAMYVDKSVLDDPAIHGRSGYPFFILALAGMAVMVWILKKVKNVQVASKS